MTNHLKNLKKYLKSNFTYNYYLENKHDYFSDFERNSINHCEDIKWVIDELEALYELVKEMKDETIKS